MTLPDMREGIEKLQTHPDFASIDKIISDLTAAKFSFGPTEMREHSRHVDQIVFQNEQLRVAIIAPKDIDFGMSRVFSLYSKNTENIRVFRTRDEALEWLDIH